MSMTHRPEIGAEVDSENRRRNRYRFLKSIFRPECTRDENRRQEQTWQGAT